MAVQRKRGGIDLSIGGESWAGFSFGSYGRARDWRINTPGGDALQACELADLRASAHDLAFLKSYSAGLSAKLAGVSMSFSPEESQLLRLSLQLLLRELPVNLYRPASKGHLMQLVAL